MIEAKYRKYKKYLRRSIQQFLIPHRNNRIVDANRRLMILNEKIEEGDEHAIELNMELLLGILDDLDKIDNVMMKDTDTYTDGKLCDENGIYIDMAAMYQSCIENNNEKIEGCKDLKRLEKKPAQLDKINSWILDLNRMNSNMLKKINKGKPDSILLAIMNKAKG